MAICVVCGIVVNPLFAIFVPFRATDRQTAPTRTSAESVGNLGTLLGIVLLTGQRETADFPPLASSSQCAEDIVSRDSSDSQLLKDNELDLLQSQSILQDLVPVSGDSSEESNQRASKRAGRDKGSSAKRSNCAGDPTFNICFTNSQGFASLLTNSELGNNENTAVRNEQLNVSNENISVNSTERSNEVINNSSANSTLNEVIINNSTERVNEVINNSTRRSNEVIDISTES